MIKRTKYSEITFILLASNYLGHGSLADFYPYRRLEYNYCDRDDSFRLVLKKEE